MNTVTVGVDVGGTKVVAAVVDADGVVSGLRRYPTPDDDAATTVTIIAKAVAELKAEFPVAAVGIGAACWLDASGEIVVHAPNLGWRDVPLRRLVGDAVSLPVVVENDANAAAWAEYVFGAGQQRDLVAITVGTGIGGGIVLNGALHRGAFGMAGEFGHTQVVAQGVRCGCGGRGCWEQYASGSALQRFAREALDSSPDSVLSAKPGVVITGPQITSAAHAHDPVALAAFNQVGHWLGVGLADLVAEYDPGVIVVGGGVADAGELLLSPTMAAYHATLATRGRPMPYARIVPAALGNTAGLVGAAHLAARAAR